MNGCKKQTVDNSSLWIFFGDFDLVRRPKERFNSKFFSYTTSTFNNFIHNTGILEFNMHVRRYTYMCDNGVKLSKLDRILVCPNFISTQPSSMVIALPRECSNIPLLYWRLMLLIMVPHHSASLTLGSYRMVSMILLKTPLNPIAEGVCLMLILLENWKQ